jgi:hypothetical protein
MAEKDSKKAPKNTEKPSKPKEEAPKSLRRRLNQSTHIRRGLRVTSSLRH